MKFRLVINCIGTAAVFGLWQNNIQAGCFMFLLCGLVCSLVDYFKDKP